MAKQKTFLAPLCLFIAWLPPTSTALQAAPKCPAPRVFNFQVTGEIRRDVPGFTEGLEIHRGAIYESTGKFRGSTRINRINPRNGHTTTLMNAGASYFGEGITFFAGRLYQLSYRERRAYLFDKDVRLLGEFAYSREGWGLTHDNHQLIASEGSNSLYFLSPEDLSTKRILRVFDKDKPLGKLNELEYVNGAIWANVFQAWEVVKISPRTGCVDGRADLATLRALMTQADRRAIAANDNFVPNGIAYDSLKNIFVVTGKNWPMLYSGRFVEAL